MSLPFQAERSALRIVCCASCSHLAPMKCFALNLLTIGVTYDSERFVLLVGDRFYSKTGVLLVFGLLQVLEELDFFAATVAYLHVATSDEASARLSLVTASIDRVDLLRYPLSPDMDLLMTGMVVSRDTF